MMNRLNKLKINQYNLKEYANKNSLRSILIDLDF